MTRVTIWISLGCCIVLGASLPADGSSLPATGQTTSIVLGDDGDIQAGAVLSYTDNADGTITDDNTVLMWEKKIKRDNSVDASNLHDADNCYPWAGACSSSGAQCGTDADCPNPQTCDVGDCQASSPDGLTIFEWVEELNSTSFAGYTDWRVPNAKELATLSDFEVIGTATTPRIATAFHGGSCGTSCTDMTSAACSCTKVNAYWTSTIYRTSFGPQQNMAYYQGFGGNNASDTNSRTSSFYVRAVRGGLDE